MSEWLLSKYQKINAGMNVEGKGTLKHCRWEYELVLLLWTVVWRFPEYLKIDLPNDPYMPLLGIYSKK